MKDLLDKLGSYNIFNYLLPGVLFAVFIEHATSVKLLQINIVIGAFVYYFLGSVISRVGSILVEPALLRFGVITYEPYEEFVRASKIDSKLEVLSEANNMYRTICALMFSIAAVTMYNFVAERLTLLQAAAPFVCVGGLFVLFLVAYRKQTAYIRKRIAANRQWSTNRSYAHLHTKRRSGAVRRRNGLVTSIYRRHVHTA